MAMRAGAESAVSEHLSKSCHDQTRITLQAHARTLNQLRAACDQSWNTAAGRLHEIAVFTARSAPGAAAMPVIGFVRRDVQAGPASDRTVHPLLNRRFRFRRIASNLGIRA
jgi:hypothetical protein